MTPARRVPVDTWVFAMDAYAADQAGRDATLFALANGFIGVRGGIDELGDHCATFLPEAHVRRPICYHERFPGYADFTDTRISVPSGVGLSVRIDDALVDFAQAELLDCQRAIDMRKGMLERTAHWRLQDGREIRVSALRLVPIGAGALVATRLAVTPVNFAARVTLVLPIAPSNGAVSTLDRDDPRINARAGDVLTQQYAQSVDAEAVHLSLASGLVVAAVQRVASASPIAADEGAAQQISARLEAGSAIAADRFVGFACNRDDRAEALAEARQCVADAAARGFDTLAGGHRRALDQYWQAAAVAIDGDEALTRAIRFNMLQLFQSASRDETRSIAAKGLSGEGYEGHYFWDTEVFMLPVLALTEPALARNILGYRHHTLAAAKANARALGHARGALYPWRTISGTEASAHYPTGSAAYHINAAIAYAIETYVTVSGDFDFMVAAGAEILFETARLWLDVGHFSARRGGAFLIHGVTGPDEYTALVDNNYYTNAMARRHLFYAAATARQLQSGFPDKYRALARRMELGEDEIGDWLQAAENMWLPTDPRLGVSPQDDSFLDKPRFERADAGADASPLLLRYHPMQLYRHQLCKQGDVVQAMVIAGDAVPRTLKARNFDYYEPLTTHDSTLSATAFAILAAELGRDREALRYHRETAFVDIEDRHNNSRHGAHMAALAGSWLALAQGWGGLRVEDGALLVRPRCPADWQGYSFRVRWRGSGIEARVDHQGTHYRLVDGGPAHFFDHGRAVTLDGEVFLPRPMVEAVIFDLDGVLTDTATAHYIAWKRLCDEVGIGFDVDVNERLKGIDRAGSLRLILEHAGRVVAADAFDAMMARKNGYYRDSIARFSPGDLFPGVVSLLSQCRRAGLKIGLASASRNAAELVERLGIADAFDHITDAGQIARPKPHPDIFLACAAAMGATPERCVGVEDAIAGIAAIHAAGMRAIGIGELAVLKTAEIVVPNIAALGIEAILATNTDNNSKQQLRRVRESRS